MKRNRNNSLFDRTLLRQSLRASFQKLDPRKMVKNPIMFTVEAVTFVMLLLIVWIAVTGNTSQGSLLYNVVVFLVLFATVLFANFAEAIAEARGKAQADSLRKTREETPAKRIDPDGQSHIVSSSDLRQGDLFECVAGDTVAADGEIVEGLASIDESAITGESAPVIREAGGDKSSVTGGTKVLSDRILVKVTARPGESFLDKMIALVEGSSRQKTPNEIALTILLAGFTIVFVIVCATLKPFADYVGANITVAAFISLFVCLIPTTIGGLLSAIGIAGMDRSAPTSSPSRARPSRLPATSTHCCSTRPVRSPSVTARPRASIRSTGSVPGSLSGCASSRRCPIRRPKASPSSNWVPSRASRPIPCNWSACTW